MAKEITKKLTLQIPAGKANPAPPVGTLLGPAGINLQEFCTRYNDATKDKMGYTLPVIVSVYEDRSFTFVVKTPPAADLLLKAAGIAKGSENSKTHTVATIKRDQAREIAKMKMPDLNANDVEAATNIICGTAKNMGIVVED